MMLVPAMAAATTHLGFGVTANLTYEPPFLFARRMSTLDHLTGGRIGWNIVTGYLDSAAKAIGLDAQAAHDDRYDLADEYMEVVYRLWEESWADDAVLLDRANHLFADPARVKKISHTGKQYRLNAMHLSSPSPQRTPVLYQAGSSTRGRQFAATHAECVFVNGQKIEGVKAIVDDIRAKAIGYGRQADDIKVFMGATIVTGKTEAEAREKFEITAVTSVRRQRWCMPPPRWVSISQNTISTSRSKRRRAMPSSRMSRQSPAAPARNGRSASFWSRWCSAAVSLR